MVPFALDKLRVAPRPFPGNHRPDDLTERPGASRKRYRSSAAYNKYYKLKDIY